MVFLACHSVLASISRDTQPVHAAIWHACVLQEVSSTVERTKEQLTVIREQLQVLQGTEGIFVKMRVFTSKVAVATVPEPAVVGEQDAAVEQADGAAAGPASSGEVAGGEDAAAELAEEPEVEITYEKVERVAVLITVDRYVEVMTGEVEELQRHVETLAQERDEVNARFSKLVALYGERPAAVKESEWWGDLVRFLKPFSKLQAALVKSRTALREAEERKKKRESSFSRR